MDRCIYKKYLAMCFALVAIISVILIGINWRMDPLQFYRKASYPAYLIDQKRFQNPGLARNYDYDTLVIGTSLSENFRTQLLKDQLGFKSLNLSMQGASANEQSLLLQVALKTGKVKNVIWDINYEYLRGDPKWVANYDGLFPFYFYDDNPWNEINNYLLSLDTTKGSLKILLRKFGVNIYQSRELEDLYTWDTKRKFGKAALQKAWQRTVKRRPTFKEQIPEYALTNLNANFDLKFLSVIKKHSEVTFYLYFPPFAPGYYVNLLAISPEIFQHMLENKKYIFEQTRGLKNLQLYDFQNVTELIFNVENYCDLMHFNGDVNEYIVESFRSQRHLAEKSRGQLESLVHGAETTEWMKNLSR